MSLKEQVGHHSGVQKVAGITAGDGSGRYENPFTVFMDANAGSAFPGASIPETISRLKRYFDLSNSASGSVCIGLAAGDSAPEEWIRSFTGPMEIQTIDMDDDPIAYGEQVIIHLITKLNNQGDLELSEQDRAKKRNFPMHVVLVLDENKILPSFYQHLNVLRDFFCVCFGLVLSENSDSCAVQSIDAANAGAGVSEVSEKSMVPNSAFRQISWRDIAQNDHLESPFEWPPVTDKKLLGDDLNVKHLLNLLTPRKKVTKSRKKSIKVTDVESLLAPFESIESFQDLCDKTQSLLKEAQKLMRIDGPSSSSHVSQKSRSSAIAGTQAALSSSSSTSASEAVTLASAPAVTKLAHDDPAESSNTVRESGMSARKLRPKDQEVLATLDTRLKTKLNALAQHALHLIRSPHEEKAQEVQDVEAKSESRGKDKADEQTMQEELEQLRKENKLLSKEKKIIEEHIEPLQQYNIHLVNNFNRLNSEYGLVLQHYNLLYHVHMNSVGRGTNMHALMPDTMAKGALDATNLRSVLPVPNSFEETEDGAAEEGAEDDSQFEYHEFYPSSDASSQAVPNAGATPDMMAYGVGAGKGALPYGSPMGFLMAGSPMATPHGSHPFLIDPRAAAAVAASISAPNPSFSASSLNRSQKEHRRSHGGGSHYQTAGSFVVGQKKSNRVSFKTYQGHMESAQGFDGGRRNAAATASSSSSADFPNTASGSSEGNTNRRARHWRSKSVWNRSRTEHLLATTASPNTDNSWRTGHGVDDEQSRWILSGGETQRRRTAKSFTFGQRSVPSMLGTCSSSRSPWKMKTSGMVETITLYKSGKLADNLKLILSRLHDDGFAPSEKNIRYYLSHNRHKITDAEWDYYARVVEESDDFDLDPMNDRIFPKGKRWDGVDLSNRSDANPDHFTPKQNQLMLEWVQSMPNIEQVHQIPMMANKLRTSNNPELAILTLAQATEMVQIMINNGWLKIRKRTFMWVPENIARGPMPSETDDCAHTPDTTKNISGEDAPLANVDDFDPSPNAECA